MQRMVRLLAVITFLFSFAQPQGAIIILNGTSSAGKSSILQKITNCVDLSMDKASYNVIAEIVENKIFNTLDQKAIDLLIANDIFTRETTSNGVRYKLPRNNPELFESKMETVEKLLPLLDTVIDYKQERFGERVLAEMTKEALQFSNRGQHVIIDTVVEYESEKQAFESAFRGSECYWVLVYCPPAELVTRVRRRNIVAQETGATKTEVRELETPIEQFLRIYAVSNDPKRSPLLDSLENPADARVSQVTLKAIFEDGADLFGKKYDVESLKRTAIDQWGLQSRRFATIAPKYRYDLIVDNGPADAAANCARQIQRLIAPTRTRPRRSAWQRFWDVVLCRRK